MTASTTAHRSAVPEGDPRLAASLRGVLGMTAADVSVAEFDRIVAGVDASHVLLTPVAVVKPHSVDQVAAVLRFAVDAGLGVTLRSGGTSLSGQAAGEGILLDTRAAFRRIQPEPGGARVRVQPGATVRQVNARLLRHGRKLGPDPASEIAATIGGVIANNSSGMACGTHHNSYRTLAALTFVLPSGTIVDTSLPDADRRLADAEPELHTGLGDLRDLLRGNAELRAEIERQYRGKNTMGYGLNSFLDFTEPVEILAHLMVGSEGTLGFVAEAVFDTVPIPSKIATALLVFPTLHAATAILPVLVGTGAATLELLDAASLRVVQADPAASGIVDDVAIDSHAALLVEYHGPDEDDLADQLERAGAALAHAGAPAMAVTRDSKERARLWRLRKGLYAAIAGARRPGTTALLEDIAVPVERLAATCAALQALFDRHGYVDAVIFGHAKDGNIHFLLTEDFTAADTLARQECFTEDLVDLVLGAGGTLKAEHGTGRIMAPFVERQFGGDLYAVMRKIKTLCDPEGVLNPGVLLTDSPTAHVEHLKLTPEVEDEVDRCVECGYCEPVCPSKDVTLTPRQRIAVRRARAAARAAGDTALDARLAAAEEYASIETCAADGMCQTACPVQINTGDLVRRLREHDANAPTRMAAAGLAGLWGPVTRGASLALTAAKLAPPVASAATAAARAVLGADVVPQWTADLPPGGPKREHVSSTAGDVVFFSACVGSMFGPTDGGIGAAAAFRLLCRRAGLQLVTPRGIDALCCGTPWKSKGLAAGHARAIEKTVGALLAASDGGRLPIVCDNSSCTEGLVHALENVGELNGAPVSLRIVDAVDFTAQRILPALNVSLRLESLALHPTCSSTRLGSNDHLRELANAIASDAIVPEAWGCCAFAGDRGMLHSELTASATAAEAAELAERGYDAYASCNRTCEIGMTRATGEPYVHILELLERATR